MLSRFTRRTQGFLQGRPVRPASTKDRNRDIEAPCVARRRRLWWQGAVRGIDGGGRAQQGGRARSRRASGGYVLSIPSLYPRYTLAIPSQVKGAEGKPP